MSKPLVTIVLKNRQKIIVDTVAVATDTDHARHITKLAIAYSGVELGNVKLAEYTLGGQHVFALLSQADGLHEVTPSR